MTQLFNTTQNLPVVAQVIEARTTWSRMRGMLGRADWPATQTLWIHRCNTIHTFFMQFPIDVIFVNRELEVKAVYHSVRPWRLILPVWGATSVFELKAGTLAAHPPKVGDILNVSP